MNSYSSASLVSHAIYKLLRYMNFFPTTTTTANTKDPIVDDDTRIAISNNGAIDEPAEPAEPAEQAEPKEMCAMCVILNITN